LLIINMCLLFRLKWCAVHAFFLLGLSVDLVKKKKNIAHIDSSKF